LATNNLAADPDIQDLSPFLRIILLIHRCDKSRAPWRCAERVMALKGTSDEKNQHQCDEKRQIEETLVTFGDRLAD
jgi:hypothetical protein